MVKISDGVWTRWHELSAASSKPYIELLLRSDSAAEVLAAEVRLVVRQIVQEHSRRQDDLGPGEDEVGDGAWGVAPVAEGVLITAGQKAEAFEEVLDAVQAELTTRGASGTIVVYEPSPVELPEWRHYCRHLGGYVWLDRDPGAPDLDRFDLLARDAVAWCLEHRPEGVLFIDCQDLPTLPLRPGQDPWEILTRLPERAAFAGLTSMSATSFRKAILHRGWNYSISVLQGAPAGGYEWIEPAHEALRSFLVAHADTVHYAYIHSGSGEASAHFPTVHEPTRIWPRNQGSAFNASRVSDFFAAQVLSPDFPPPANHPDWTHTELADSRLLLEHKQPELWFGPQDPVLEVMGELFPAPELIASTRVHFADLCVPQRENSLTWDQVARAERMLGRAPGSGPGRGYTFSIILADGRTEDGVRITSEGGLWRHQMEGPPLEVDASQVVDLVYAPRGWD
jgi:hypothetical protein